MQFVFCSKAPALALLSPLCNSRYIFKAKVRQTSVLEQNMEQILSLVSGVVFLSLIGHILPIHQSFTDRYPTSRPREKNYRKKYVLTKMLYWSKLAETGHSLSTLKTWDLELLKQRLSMDYS